MITISTPAGSVSGLLTVPVGARWLYVLAHGAGAGMRHPFLTGMADRLAARGVGSLRYQFPYMESGKRRPDLPHVAEATVRAAVAAAAQAAPTCRLVAGGKSFGGRVTSLALARERLPGVRGLVFLGFPLHAPKRLGDQRAAHLADVDVPMLFVQGTRDDLADLALMRDVCARLGPRVTLHVVEGGDHSFRVPRKTGRSEAEVLDELAKVVDRWLTGLDG